MVALVLSLSNIKCHQQAHKYSIQRQIGYVQKVSLLLIILSLLVAAVVVKVMLAVVVQVAIAQALDLQLQQVKHIQSQSVVADRVDLDHL
jgi:hypothetical protein